MVVLLEDFRRLVQRVCRQGSLSSGLSDAVSGLDVGASDITVPYSYVLKRQHKYSMLTPLSESVPKRASALRLKPKVFAARVPVWRNLFRIACGQTARTLLSAVRHCCAARSRRVRALAVRKR